MTGRPVSTIGTATLTGTYREHTSQAPFAKAMAIGGLPMPIAANALPCPASPCFPDPESKNLNRLGLISFRFARACEAARPSSQCVGRAAEAGLTVARASAER
jgi:hypothetical protein